MAPGPSEWQDASRYLLFATERCYADAFADSAVNALSGGHFHSLCPVHRRTLTYKIAADGSEICGPFSGLEFGPVNEMNDRVLTSTRDDSCVRPFISIGGQPFFASVRREHAEVFVLAGASIMDLEAEVGGLPLTDYFSQVVPPCMVLRHLFRKACWHPNQHQAVLTIDDPVLRPNYGFLNYERLLGLMDRYNFHTSIAFIPYNFRRTSPAVTRIFQRRPDRYSICFHGNDHTEAEFALKDPGLLNVMLKTAIERMDVHHRKTESTVTG